LLLAGKFKRLLTKQKHVLKQKKRVVIKGTLSKNNVKNDERLYKLYEEKDTRFYFDAHTKKNPLNGDKELIVGYRAKVDEGGQEYRIEGFNAKKEYQAAFSHFKDVDVVHNSWIADNQSKFNQLTAKGMPPREAALQTWDAKQIQKAGFH